MRELADTMTNELARAFQETAGEIRGFDIDISGDAVRASGLERWMQAVQNQWVAFKTPLLGGLQDLSGDDWGRTEDWWRRAEAVLREAAGNSRERAESSLQRGWPSNTQDAMEALRESQARALESVGDMFAGWNEHIKEGGAYDEYMGDIELNDALVVQAMQHLIPQVMEGSLFVEQDEDDPTRIGIGFE